MKSIKITNIISENSSKHKYKIILGNSIEAKFTNTKKAESFLTSVNKNLNEKLRNLNSIYITIYSDFRANWLYYDDYRWTQAIEIQNLSKEVEEIFDLIIDTSTTENGGITVFEQLHDIIERLLSIIEIHKTLLKDRSNFAAASFISLQEKNIQAIKVDLNTVGTPLTNSQ